MISINKEKGVKKLANHKSAIKRAKQNTIKQKRNNVVRTRVKNSVKQVQLAVSEGNQESAESALNSAKSTIHKASKKGVMHDKNASRKISRLSTLVNSLSA